MGFLSSIFGGSQSQSSNSNNGLVTGNAQSTVGNGQTANNYLTSLLTGTGNTAASSAGYKNYLQLAGYAPAMTQLSKSVTGQGAAAGLLNSGADATALQNQGATLNNQFFNNYLQGLGGLSSQGLQANSTIAGAGQQSTSSNNTGLLGQNSGGGTNLGDFASIFAI